MSLLNSIGLFLKRQYHIFCAWTIFGYRKCILLTQLVPNFLLSIPMLNVLLVRLCHDSVIIIVYKSSSEVTALFCYIILYLYYWFVVNRMLISWQFFPIICPCSATSFFFITQTCLQVASWWSHPDRNHPNNISRCFSLKLSHTQNSLFYNAMKINFGDPPQ